MIQQQIVAGDTLNFLTPGGDYPASDGWALSYVLTPRSALNGAITITSSAEGDDHRVTVPGATSALWDAGEYGWAAIVELGTERYTVERGQITVVADPSALSPGADTRSAAEIALANIQAFLQGRASDGVLRYRINGREIERHSMADLIILERRLIAEVAREADAARAARGLVGTRRMAVRMGRA